MREIKIAITNRQATVLGTPIIVCGNSDYAVVFTLDDEWAAHNTKTARFVYRSEGVNRYQDIEFTGTSCEVPILYGVDFVSIGVYAGELKTSTPAKVPCLSCILDGDPEPDNTEAPAKGTTTFEAEYGATAYADIKAAYDDGKDIKVKMQAGGIAAGFYDDDGNLIASWEEIAAKGYNIEVDESGYTLDGILMEYDPNYECIVKKVIIPYGVTRIGSYAFHYESNWLQSGIHTILIPDSVTEIADYAFLPLFSADGNLREIAVPDSVISIGTDAFGDDATACVYYNGEQGNWSCNTHNSYDSAPDTLKYPSPDTLVANLSKAKATAFVFGAVADDQIVQITVGTSNNWAYTEKAL